MKFESCTPDRDHYYNLSYLLHLLKSNRVRFVDIPQHNLVNPGPDPEVLNAAFPGRLESLLNWRRDSLFEGTSVVSDHVLVMQLHVQPQAGPCHSSTKFSARLLPASPREGCIFPLQPSQKKKRCYLLGCFFSKKYFSCFNLFPASQLEYLFIALY